MISHYIERQSNIKLVGNKKLELIESLCQDIEYGKYQMEKFNGIKKIRAKYSAQGIPHERRLLLFQKTVLKDSLNQNEQKLLLQENNMAIQTLEVDVNLKVGA